MKLRGAFYANLTTTVPEPFKITWPELGTRFSKARIANIRTTIPLVSFIVLEPLERKAANVRYVDILGIDFDE